MSCQIFLTLCIGLILASTYAKPTSENSARTYQMVPVKDLTTKGRIVHGQQAVNGAFPWHAGIYIDLRDGGSIFCSGSLISESWVLSVAHCLVNVAQAELVFGNVNIRSPEQQVQGLIVVINLGYSPNDVINDVAVLYLNPFINVTNNVSPIPLGTDPLGEGVQVNVSGFGLTGDNDTTMSQTLNYITLQTISNSDCTAAYGGTNIPDPIVCAVGSNAESICDGDSGGALVTGYGSSAVQVGIVNFASQDTCESGIPSGFARISTYYDWIDNAIHWGGGKKKIILLNRNSRRVSQ